MMDWDISLVVWIQELFGPDSRTFWSVTTALGSPPALMLMIGFVLWIYGAKAGLRILIALVSVGVLVDALKVITVHPRPYYLFESVHAWRSSDGFGMPSFHAAGIFIVVTTFAASLRRRASTWVLAALVVVVVSVSRVYFGVHSFLQVLAGWSIASFVMFAVLRFEKPVVPLFKALGMWKQLALAASCLLALVLFKITFIANRSANFETPNAWTERYAQAQIYEAELAAKPLAEVESLSLFDKFEIDYFGPIVGVWILAVYLSHPGARLVEFTRREKTTNVLFGMLFYSLVLAPLMAVAAGFPIAAGIILVGVPFIMAVGVPATASVVTRRFSREAARPEK